MDALDVVNLRPLMKLGAGHPQITIGLIDGPVMLNHPLFMNARLRMISEATACQDLNNTNPACLHGTFIAGFFTARRGSDAPAICPDCNVLVRPIFLQDDSTSVEMPSASAEELATAVVECIESGARLLNLSVALAQPSVKGERIIEEALDYAAKRGVIVVAAAGNQATLGSTSITRHPWVIPVAACDLRGIPIRESNIGHSIGRRGLSAPGDGITSLGSTGKLLTLRGTSAATPFVSGAIALLWSLFPEATATEVKVAITTASNLSRPTVIPRLLNAWSSYQQMKTSHEELEDNRPIPMRLCAVAPIRHPLFM